MKGPMAHPAMNLILAFVQLWYSVNGCSPNPCLNLGTCTGNIFSFTCTCQSGYTGTICETNIDDCGVDSCSNRGACLDGTADVTCLCQDTCTGEMCETCTDPPEDPSCNPCDNGGTEVNDFCYCAPGFTGDTCSDVTCGDPPAYPYTTRESTGSLPGDVATFDCQSGFDRCVDPARVVCQASGEWESLTNVCDPSSVTNLSPYTFYPTPCQPSSYLRLELEVSLTGTSSRLEVRSGNNYIYVVEFRRINFYWYTIFYTFIKNTYYYVWYYGVPLNLNQSNQVTITLINGNYVFSANGFVITRTDISGVTPDAFRFSGTIAVPSLDMFHSQ